MSELYEISRDLDDRGKRMILALSRGESLDSACAYGGYERTGAATYVLSKPKLREAIQRVALTLRDPMQSLNIAAIFAAHRLASAAMGLASIKQTQLQAIRDVLDRAGYGAVSKSEHTSKSISAVLRQMDAGKTVSGRAKLTQGTTTRGLVSADRGMPEIAVSDTTDTRGVVEAIDADEVVPKD